MPRHLRSPVRVALLFVLGAVLAAGPLAASVAAAAPVELDPAPAAAEPDPAVVPTDIVIRYESGTTASERRAVKTEHGLERVSISADRRTEVVRVSGAARPSARSVAGASGALAAESAVEAVGLNYRRYLAIEPTSEQWFSREWGLHNTGQTINGITQETGVSDVDIDGLQALRLGTGHPNVVVAVIDDGVDTDHPDLDSTIWTNPGESGGGKETNGVDDDGNGLPDDVHGWDFCENDNDVFEDSNPNDGSVNGHGTHVTGTIAAEYNGIGTVGVAPGVTILPIRFISGTSACGNDSQAIEAIDYAASFGVGIINASWGGPGFNAALEASMDDSDALFVAAAGNRSAGGLDMDAPGVANFYPAASTLPNVLAVAAADQDGRRAGFSMYGPKSVDIAGPGVNILSTHPPVSGCPSPCYAWSNGTSMAAPHVSGVAALVQSFASSPLSISTLKSRILGNGQNLSKMSGETKTGDMVNAYRALDVTDPVAAKPDRFRLSVGSILGSSTATAVVQWPEASDDLTGIDHYSLKKHVGSTWSTVTSSTEELFARPTIKFGSDYLFRVRAYDNVDNDDAADSPTVEATLHHETSSLATYGTGWSTSSSSGASNGKLRTTTTAGAEMTFTFTGRSVSIVAPKGSSRGAFEVYVDGGFASTVDLHATSAASRVVVFATTWTSTGTHSVRIVNLATPGHPRIDIDSFVVFRTA